MTTHAPIGFSSLPRFVRCPGARTLGAKCPPEPDSPAAIEGTVAHWVAYSLFNGIDVPVGTEKNGIKVDEDMRAGARLWTETVPKGGVAELPVIAPSIHGTDCWGTPDLWEWDEPQALLSVFEYKYGFRLVDEFENEQLIGQACGIMDTLGIKPKQIRLVVVQPRGYGASKIRSWFVPIEEFPKHLEVIQDAINDGHTTNAGPHCLYCPARQICATFQRAASAVVEFQGQAEAVTLTTEQMGAEYTALCEAEKILAARKTVLGAMVESELRKGQRVTGWEMKEKKSPLAWSIPPAEVLAAAKLCGYNLEKPAEPITPTQALERKLIDEDSIKLLASRPPSSMKLSPVSTDITRRIFT